MGLPWDPYVTSIFRGASLWCFHGTSDGSSTGPHHPWGTSICDASTVLPWCSHGAPMGLPCFHGTFTSMVLPWGFHGIGHGSLAIEVPLGLSTRQIVIMYITPRESDPRPTTYNPNHSQLYPSGQQKNRFWKQKNKKTSVVRKTLLSLPELL